jgi:hypothetical protein
MVHSKYKNCANCIFYTPLAMVILLVTLTQYIVVYVKRVQKILV